MSRSWVGDDQEAFRVVVRRKKMISNPGYEQGNGQHYYALADEEYDTWYGPYPKLGTARGVQAHEAYVSAYMTDSGRARSELRWGTVSTWIERAVKIEWEQVDD